MGWRAKGWVWWAVWTGCLAARVWAQGGSGESPGGRRGGAAAAEPSSAEFVRVRRDAQGVPLALETAIVRFQAEGGEGSPAEVTLIGAVHIGDRAYYEALNREFERYDAVLYELVAPQGTRVPTGGGDPELHPVRMLQDGMRHLLGLESQLELIDYQKANLVHADLSPEEFADAMQERGESIWTLAFRMFGQSLADQGASSESAGDEAALFAALLSGDRDAFRRALATQFEDIESMLSAVSGPEGSALITDRNRRALEELDRQWAAGKRKLAIFYGAGHLGEMADDLAARGLYPVETRWLSAWDLAPPANEPAEPRARRKQPETPPASPPAEGEPGALIFQESDV